jgi:hypothetical protein
MNRAEIEEIEKLIEDAEQGPWKSASDAQFSGSDSFPFMVLLDYGVGPCNPNVVACRTSKANAAYIAKMSPSTAERMCKRIGELYSELKDVREGMVCVCRLNPLVGKPVPCKTCRIDSVLRSEGQHVRSSRRE